MNPSDYATITAILIGHAIVLTATLTTNRTTRAIATADRTNTDTDTLMATLRWAIDAGSDTTNPTRARAVRSLLVTLAVAPDLTPSQRALVNTLLKDLGRPTTRRSR